MKKTLMLTAHQGGVAIASALKRPGSKEFLINKDGEINADTKQELASAIQQIIEVASSGQRIGTEAQAMKSSEIVQLHREAVLAAFDDKNELARLGDLLADNITQSISRDGFARRMMRYQELTTGQLPQARMSVKNVTASYAVGPIQTATQFIRDNIYYAGEFYITARPFIEMKDIQRSTNDILEEKYNEALEAIMVQEDRTWKRMVDVLIGIDNPHLNIAGALTPAAFSELVGYVSDWGVAPGTVLIASDVWQDIVTGGWKDVLEPVSQFEIMQTGKLGTVYGMNIMSDTFRVPTQRVLSAGDIYVIGSPDQHGQMTDRGGVESQPIDISHEKVPGRGWAMSETVSMVITNSRSVARGRRTK